MVTYAHLYCTGLDKQGRTKRARGGGAVAPLGNLNVAGLYLVALLVRNLYTGDPCEGVRSLPSQTKNPRNGPDKPGLYL